MSGVEFKGITYEIDERSNLATGRMLVGGECVGFSGVTGMTREDLQKQFESAASAQWIVKGAYS
ncbi:MAG TPA: hypothetical protein VIG74_01315, partial [Alphaproteobacteria bacterium]